MELALDLAPAAIDVPRIGWRKAAGEPGTLDASAVVPADGPIQITDFALTSRALSAEGSREARSSPFRIERLRLDPVRLGQSEGTVALRGDGALSLSLVADIDGRIAGHIAFSAVRIEDGSEHWYGLAPVAVAARDQGHGVGKALVRAGLTELERMGARGCVVLGDPGYYAQFGFRAQPTLLFPGVPAQYFQALAFAEAPMPGGRVRYHDSFYPDG